LPVASEDEFDFFCSDCEKYGNEAMVRSPVLKSVFEPEPVRNLHRCEAAARFGDEPTLSARVGRW
jgi:hypothetical protein